LSGPTTEPRTGRYLPASRQAAQTGAAAAIDGHGPETRLSGYCPGGHKAEDGTIAPRYHFEETPRGG